jgi:MoaA/NifB/PqqE/SkfB family radical SAM enzyme
MASPERYAESRLRVLQNPDPDSDDDLLFLFLVEDTVFLKLTRTCNNICSFCCDTVFWNGTHMDAEKVRARMREGAGKGLPRLFLSGGEPTIHPDYLSFIEYGKQLGFSRISTITNGRMFYYPQFAARAVRGGLNEVIFSLNSHDEATHDALVGVKGAYAQCVAGIRNVRRLGCKFVMNVVVTARNVAQLPDMIRAFHAMGARSATFQQLIPNDRDWARSRNSIYYETERAREPVRAALSVARALGFSPEFKKFPDDFFEGFESQIAEPTSWAMELGEIDWRRPDRHAPYKAGGAVKCWGERCSYCAYRPFCSHLMRHQATRNEARFDGFELDATSAQLAESVQAAMQRQPDAPVRVLAPDAGAALALVSAMEGRPRAVWLDSLEGAASLPADVALVASTPAQLDAAAELDNPVEVELNVDTLAWLRAHQAWVRDKGDRLTLSPQVFLRLENAKARQVNLPQALSSLPVERARLVNVPACLSGGREPSAPQSFATEELLREAEDVPAHARHYFFRGYMTKSARCAGCSVTDRCAGVHINYVRQFGYAALEPIRAPAGSDPGDPP